MSFFTFFAFGQLSEGFEGASFPPTGWVVDDNGIGTAQDWARTSATGFGWVYQGTYSATVNRDNGVTSPGLAQDYLITPQVTVPTNGQVRFYGRSASAGEQGSIYKVMLSTTTQDRASFNITLGTFNELQMNELGFQQFVLPLTAYVGQNVYIAFVMEVNNGLGDRWVIDNVNIDQQCFAPTALAATPLGTSANLSWTYTGPATQFEIEYGPAGFTQGTGTIVSPVSNPYTLTGLSPLTGYTYYVRAICSADNLSPWSTSKNFTTTALPPVCGGNFVDSGGVSGNYASNENITTVICPTNPGELVTVTFTSFNTESGFDVLRIYDGNSITAPLLGTYSGTALPPSFTSTSADGCLTFRFTSDGSVVRAGWTANITCAPAPTCRKPTNILVSGANSSSASVSWVDVAGASQWEIIWLPAGSPAPGPGATPNAITSSNPYLITGLNSATNYVVYVRAICVPGVDVSEWSAVTPFSTTPNFCAGDAFTDPGGPTGQYGNSANVTTTICPENPGDVVMVIFNSFNLENNFDNLRIYDGNSTAAPLIGTYTGTNLPPQVIASSASGCLTFNFTSDGSVTRDGWNASVICGPPPACTQPTNLTVTNITPSGATIGWTETNPGVTSWQVVVQPAGTGYPNASSTVINVSTNPYTITGLNPNLSYEYYVLSNCGATDGLSFWSGPVRFNTLFAGCNGSTPAGNECAVAPPVCNLDGYCGNTSGTYTDNSWPALDTAFCGSIENNSFLSFQAASTSISLAVNVGNCTNGSGIQFMIFSTTACGSGAVTNLGCFGNMNPGLNNLTFNGLTPGQNYFLMIDGFAGAICDYSVTVTSGGSTTTDVVLTPQNPTMCMGQTLTLNATGGNGVYNWSPNTGLSAVTGTSVVFTPPAPGTYTIVVESTDTNALCSTQSSTVITVLDVLTPTFTTITPICSGATAPVLPTTSTNGVTGTWSPATVSNTNSATYTFTPTAGQCAVPTTLDVIVLDQTVPSFIAISPFCSGSPAPTLNTTSNNGITGTWSPAIVDNLNSGTYTFTPDAGQCATTTTMFVEVLTNCTFNSLATAVWIENCTNTSTDGDFFNITGSGTNLIGVSSNVFPSSNLGNYVQNSGNLIFRGAELKSFKTSTSNVCSARLNYRIYEASATPGAFTVLNLPLFDTCSAGTFPTGGVCNAGDQKWQEILSDSESPINLTTLAPGDYIIEVFFDLTGDNDNASQCDDIIFVNNNGANYLATFSIQGNPTFASTNPTSCIGTEGSITISGFTPNVSYGITYTDDLVAVGPLNVIANASGQIILTGLNAGVYSNFVFQVNGCTFTNSAQITLVDPIYTPTFSPIGPFCAGDTIVLPTISIEGFTGTWNLPVDNTQTQTYTFIPTAGQCAQNSAPFTVVVNPAPSVTSLVSNSPICNGQDAIFTVTGTPNATIIYNINGGANQNATVDASGQYVHTITSPAANVTFNLLDIDNGACNIPLSLSQTVVVTPLPTATLTVVDSNICIGSGNAEFTINGTSNAVVTYNINGGANQTVTLSTSGIATITVTSPTSDVTVTLTNVNSGLCDRVITGQSGTVVVTSIPIPAINVTQTPICSNQTAAFTVTSPVNTQLNFPTDLFISEITDHTTGALTYVEIYNGTGNTVDLSNYRLKVYTSLTGAPSCDLLLSGTIANNDVVVVKLSSSANQGGVVPDLTFTTCAGVNNNDSIVLTTSAGVELDNWGVNGTVFTPGGGVGYNYRRNISAVLPSMTWNPADWNVIDWTTTAPNLPDYSDVGFYSLYVTNFSYTLSDGVNTTTQSSVNFTNVAPGTYTLVATDLITGCISNPLTFTINPFVNTNPITTFTYSTPVCITSSSILSPDTSVTGFTTGGSFSSTTGLSINPTTGVIDLSTSAPGTYVVTYSVLANSSTCTNASSSQFTLVITPSTTPTFTQVDDLCLGAIITLPTTSAEGITGVWTPSNVDTTQIGVITYTFTPNAGFCSDTATMDIRVYGCEIPKGISPNGDGKNDSWDLSGYNISKVEIFNRYGTMVYSKSNYSNEWFGQSDNGNELPDGTYYYVIKFNDLPSKTGWVYINRQQ
ncbi:fibronectin type III domain-containing protein [Flavobacterium sp. HXWNR69]|uniref:Fibronectin type III domain-containing protein n=1 Tax=Flavobacterium fragile TaxID=2949085 RepID=A0ABT0TJR8_9FLAO|nr:fibronectin type III domain-containing protein [Flavobacterium sp. HXWNR69]MCL9770625.1 fibronectin type III domain-containing protein [Flavobacterium sp. HXWNR69]